MRYCKSGISGSTLIAIRNAIMTQQQRFHRPFQHDFKLNFIIIYLLLTALTSSLYPDKARQNVGPDQDPNFFAL